VAPHAGLDKKFLIKSWDTLLLTDLPIRGYTAQRESGLASWYRLERVLLGARDFLAPPR